MLNYIRYIKTLLAEAEDRYDNTLFEIRELEESYDTKNLLYDNAERQFNQEVSYLINNCIDRQLPVRYIKIIFDNYENILNNYELEEV